jgi:hypothetical protein
MIYRGFDRHECTCNEMDPFDLHSCPFQEDVNNDPNYECSCCPECEYQCAMDI